MSNDYKQYEALHNYWLRREAELRMNAPVKTIWVTFRKE
jgi:hypothetical protein